MSKGKGTDPIEEAHERANHNINPYYWFNKTDRDISTNWIRNLSQAPFEFIALSLALLFILAVLKAENSFSSTGILLIVIIPFWYISLLRTRKFLAIRKQLKELYREMPKESKKKKLPKHRKDYK